MIHQSLPRFAILAAHRSILSLLIGAFLLAAIVPACSKRQESPTSHAMTLKVGYLPIAECLPLYVAEELGYFESRGLDVELISFQGGAYVLKELTNDGIDVGFSNVVSLVLHAAEGAPFYSVYGATYETPRNQNHALAVRGDLPEGPLADMLRGRTIAVNTHRNIESLMLERFMRQQGLTTDDYSMEAHAFPQMLPLLEANRVDAACLVEPFISMARAAPAPNARVIANQYLSTSDRTLVATYVTSQRALDEKGAALTAFAAALRDATAFISTNESRSRSLLSRYTKIADDQLMVIGLPEFQDAISPPDLESIITDIRAFNYLGQRSAPAAADLIKRP